MSNLNPKQNVVDAARALVASWDQWQANPVEEIAKMAVDSGMRRLSKAIDELDVFAGVSFGFVGHPGSSGGGCDGHTPPPVLGGKI